MKLFVRILQVALALWVITGSVYMMGHYEVLANTWAYNTLPAIFWIALGSLQLLCALGLLVSVKDGPMSMYATPAAGILAVVTLSGIFLYGAYAGLTGMLWAVVPAAILAFVAYMRRQQPGAPKEINDEL